MSPCNLSHARRCGGLPTVGDPSSACKLGVRSLSVMFLQWRLIQRTRPAFACTALWIAPRCTEWAEDNLWVQYGRATMVVRPGRLTRKFRHWEFRISAGRLRKRWVASREFLWVWFRRARVGNFHFSWRRNCAGTTTAWARLENLPQALMLRNQMELRWQICIWCKRWLLIGALLGLSTWLRMKACW